MSFNGNYGNIPSNDNDRQPQYDKYGSPYYGANKGGTSGYLKRRFDSMVQINPVPGESVYNYTQRLSPILKHWEDANLQGHIYGRKVWFTHRNPSGCWICDSITFIWTLLDTVFTLRRELPNDGHDHYYVEDPDTHFVTLQHRPPTTVQ